MKVPVLDLSFGISDAGGLDSREVIIDWGDGGLTGYPQGLAPGFIATQHRYADDNASDSYTIHITVTDDDGGTTTTSRTVTVTNVAPVIENAVLSPSILDEGSVLDLSFGISDAGFWTVAR